MIVVLALAAIVGVVVAAVLFLTRPPSSVEPQLKTERIDRIYDPAMSGLANSGPVIAPANSFPAGTSEPCQAAYLRILARATTGQLLGRQSGPGASGVVLAYATVGEAQKAFADLQSNYRDCVTPAKAPVGVQQTDRKPGYITYRTGVSQDLIMQYGNVLQVITYAQAPNYAELAASFKQRIDAVAAGR